MRAILLAFLTALVALPASAGDPQAMRRLSDVIEVSVRPGWREGGGRHVAALDVRLAPGWKTFWRAAGPAGIAPRFDWDATEGAVRARWPVPEVFEVGGTRALGFRDDFVLPLVLEGVGAGPVRLRGTLELAVCREVCLPVRLEVDASLPARGADDRAIRAALASKPRRAAAARCRTRPTESGAMLSLEMRLGPTGRGEMVVIEPADPSIWVADPLVRRRGNVLRAEAELMVGGGRRVTLDREALRVTVVGADGAFEVGGCRR